jgi:hypothetical protein
MVQRQALSDQGRRTITGNKLFKGSTPLNQARTEHPLLRDRRRLVEPSLQHRGTLVRDYKNHPGDESNRSNTKSTSEDVRRE